MEIFQTDSQLKETVESLEAQRSLRKQRGLLAKEFLQSEFLKDFLLPDIETERLSVYPKPDKPEWEDAYRYAYAKDEVYSAFLNRIQSWAKEAETILTQENEIPKTIV